jgi:signal peptidase I
MFRKKANNETDRQQAPPPEGSARIKAEALDWLKSLAFALPLALILRATVVQSYVIPTPSMSPTIMPSDRVFGNRFIYHFRGPQRGDIVAFDPTPEVIQRNGKDALLKRVVAIGGDIVEVRESKLFVNGRPCTEPYIMEPPHYVMPPRRVPKGDVFVMGDNRNDSYDSHYWGPLPVRNIQAKAFFRFWPVSRIGLLH